MKKITILTLILISILSSCSDHSRYSISGRISNATNEYIYLDELKLSSINPIDSVVINKDGKFKFTGEVNSPRFFILRLAPNNFITLLVDSAEQVVINADAANFSREYRVEGSVGSLYVQELNSKLSSTKHSLDSIRSLQLILKKDKDFEAKNAKWEDQYDSVRTEQIKYSQKFILDHPFSMANVLALYQKFNDDSYVIQDLKSLQVAASALSSLYPESEHVQALYNNTLQLMKDERTSAIRELIKTHGKNSPEIELPTPKGNNVKLSSLQGKYVLVHFWSAQERGSRIVNPTLVEAYNKYKSKKFTIYQVSIDTNKTIWEEAIKEDKLNWTNVGDMEGSHDATLSYNIKHIPSNYLLDPEGNIIAKNLQGPNLNRTLSEVLK